MAKRSKQKKQERRNKMAERAKRRAERQKDRGGGGTKFKSDDGINFFQPKEGRYEIDIIPYVVTVENNPDGIEEGEQNYVRTIFTHRNIGAEEKDYICRRTIGKRCPVCEDYAEKKRDPSISDEVTKSIKQKEREIYNVIDLNDSDKGIQLWEVSPFLFGDLLDKEIREDEDFAGFADLEEGLTLSIRFTKEKKGGFEFLKVDRIDFKEREEPYDESILEEAHDLDRIINVLSYEKLEKIYYELDDVEEEDERKEEDEEDEEDEEEDEEEETKSKKTKSTSKKSSSKKKSKKVEEEDDEEEEEDDLPFTEDEDEDEPPEKSKSSSKKKTAMTRGKKKKSSDEEEEQEELECPVEDGEFGVDTNSFDECEECDIWRQCQEAKDAKRKKKKKR